MGAERKLLEFNWLSTFSAVLETSLGQQDILVSDQGFEPI
jgi:hypothetical protein